MKLPKKFGEVKDVEVEEWTDDVSDFVVPVTGMEAMYEACCKISKDIVLALLGIRDSVLEIFARIRKLFVWPDMVEIRRFARRIFIELLEFWRNCKWLMR